MISCLIPVLLFVASFVSYKANIGGEANPLAVILLVFGVIASIIVIIIVCASTSSVVESRTKITEAKRNMEVAEERSGALKAIIASFANKYPAEEELFKSFKIEALLLLPEIKSDEFLLAQIKMAVSYQEKIYRLKEEINSCKQQLDWFANMRWCIPFFASPKYDDSDDDDKSTEAAGTETSEA